MECHHWWLPLPTDTNIQINFPSFLSHRLFSLTLFIPVLDYGTSNPIVFLKSGAAEHPPPAPLSGIGFQLKLLPALLGHLTSPQFMATQFGRAWVFSLLFHPKDFYNYTIGSFLWKAIDKKGNQNTSVLQRLHLKNHSVSAFNFLFRLKLRNWDQKLNWGGGSRLGRFFDVGPLSKDWASVINKDRGTLNVEMGQ